MGPIMDMVSVGSYKRTMTSPFTGAMSDPSHDAVHVNVTNFRIHPKYNGALYDFMLLKLEEPILDKEIIRLNVNPTLPRVGQELTVIGMGLTEPGDKDSVSRFLKELPIERVPEEECNTDVWDEIMPLDEDKVLFCAGYEDIPGNQDSCKVRWAAA